MIQYSDLKRIWISSFQPWLCAAVGFNRQNDSS